MTWIRVLDDQGPGRTDNIMRVHSLHEEGLTAHLALYEALPLQPQFERPDCPAQTSSDLR